MKHVLITDDEERVVKVLMLLLRHPELQIDQASSGEEALDMLKAKKYDLLILDLMLPGLSGNEVLKELRQNPAYEHVPIIVLSGRNEDSTVLDTLKDGAAYYLTKPFEPTDLKDTLSLALGIAYD
jgi:DNA-binding response OmpR family regulator